MEVGASSSDEEPCIYSSPATSRIISKITDDDLIGQCLVCNLEFRIPSTKYRRGLVSLTRSEDKGRKKEKAIKNASQEIHRIHRAIEGVVGKGMNEYPVELDRADITARVVAMKSYLFEIINGLS